MAWKLDESNLLGVLECGALSGQVQLTLPQRGLHELRLQSQPFAGRICSVERDSGASAAASPCVWPAALVDAYVRGPDLVATYQGDNAWPFAPQIYWRGESPAAGADRLARVTLLVSVSTHLLDTHPRICAVTELAADEVIHVDAQVDRAPRFAALSGLGETTLRPTTGACCLLWRLAGGLLSYAEVVLASDFCELVVRCDQGDALQARWELIAEFLEKGVIRRTQLQGVLLPRDGDVDLATQICREVVARPLPLTT